MLIEPHAFVRAALRQTLSTPDIELVAEASSAEEALQRVTEARPDVMLVAVDLPGMDGIQLARELAPRYPATKIVMLTTSDRSEDVVAAMRAGAAGYLTMDISPEALIRAIRGLRNGDLPMPRRLAAELVSHLVGANARRQSSLSEREGQVLALVADGLTDREVAQSLGISPRTVGRHVGSILAKLGVRNRAEASRRYHAER